MHFLSRFFKMASPKAGMPPGSPVFLGQKSVQSPCLSLIDYNQESYSHEQGVSPQTLRPFAETATCSWVDLDRVHDVSLVQEVAGQFGLHALTVEDMVNPRQRIKVEEYDDYLFLVIRVPEYDRPNHQLHLSQVSLILTRHALLSFQEKPSTCFEPVRRRIKGGVGRIRSKGLDYLAYALLDAAVDSFFVALEQVGEDLAELDEELLHNPQPITMQRIHHLKREMVMLRKAVWPLREMVASLQHDELSFIKDGVDFYLRDLYDHTIQVMETVETYRDIISGMLDMYLSTISQRTNEVMKILTIFAAIFIPLTFIAGVYGMNFNPEKSPYNMPELNWLYGYPMALALMAAVALGMIIFFKRNKWF